MAREVWLRPNRRALSLGLALPVLLLAVGAATLAASHQPWLLAAGGLALACGVAALLAVLGAMRTPRLGYQDGQLLVNLGGPTRRVPIELIECFFLGKAPSLLPGSAAGRTGSPTTSTVVVRLAESARDWRQVDVKRALGQWCDGYITIRGTWCERLDETLVNQLNQRLIEAHRRAAAAREARTA